MSAEVNTTKILATKNGENKEAMDLFDDYWFFKNALNSRKSLSPLPPLPKTPLFNKGKEFEVSSGSSTSDQVPESSEEDEGEREEREEEDVNESLMKKTEESPLMIRAPSMPSPCIDEIFDGFQDDGVIHNNNKLKGSRLRNASSNLGCHHSWHSAFEKTPPNPRFARQNSSISSKNYVLTHNYYRFNETNYKAFQEKKWKSSSDLESIEVQGFKDLGFVFDKEDLKESLATVIPGLREKKEKETEEEGEEEGKITRPYLSEAWNVKRTLTTPSFKLMEKRSADEIKDQLRFWARAVACNVRQEC
ncbi:hypothetical protein LUZ60_009967 [Juncus effusus]|nr:hypothetical protein LUZ60_009967 [Juncus effusus]